MSSSRNSSKSGGLRYLWIPGRKKSHPKGRFDSTNKRLNYSTGQKKNEQWSLGGSKGQSELLKAEADGFDSGPSISGLGPISCAAGVPTIACTTNMPALTENKFTILGKISEQDQLPSPPRDGNHNGTTDIHISASDLIGDSVSNHNLKKIDEDIEDDDLPSPPGCDEHNSDVISEYSPHKKTVIANNRRNCPEVDINSIESVSECKLKYSELDLPDGIYSSSQLDEPYTKKNKKKKKKNKNKNSPSHDTNNEDDDKTVKCLYYTLMCCECTIT